MRILANQFRSIERILFYNFWQWQYYKRKHNKDVPCKDRAPTEFRLKVSDDVYNPTSEQLMDDIAAGNYYCPGQFHYGLDGDIGVYIVNASKESIIIKVNKWAQNDVVMNFIAFHLYLFKQYAESGQTYIDDNYFNLLNAIDFSRINSKPFVAFKSADEIHRAIGLWLWDYVHKHDCSQAEAIRALEEKYDLSALGKSKVEEADLRHYIKRTDACIQSAEVLTFSKKGNRRNDSGSRDQTQ